MVTKHILIASAFCLCSAAAEAAVIHPVSVSAASQNGTLVGAARSQTANALGDADGKFYSLGSGGWITFDFGTRVQGIGSVTEVTWNNRSGYKESAKLFVSNDGVHFTPTGVTLSNLKETTALSFATASSFRYLKLVDTSAVARGRDGFDIDSISLSPVPLPAPALMLGGALAGLGFLRRRRHA